MSPGTFFIKTGLFWAVASAVVGKITIDKSGFEHDFDDWTVKNGSWKRVDFSYLKKHFSSVKMMPNMNTSKAVVIPTNETGLDISMMYKDIEVPPLATLEVYFMCLVLGWNGDFDPVDRMSNPTLQILYDDVIVFNLDTAISNSSGNYVKERWNQFRLLSSYHSNFSMRITLMGSMGRGFDTLVAVDNLIIKITSNWTENNTSEEPVAKIREKDGEWETILTESEEEENSAEQRDSISLSPEFCDLLPEKGPCSGNYTRYYYNTTANRCEKFLYGGCNGNENNFHAKLSCEIICKQPNKSEDNQIFDVVFLGTPIHIGGIIKTKTVEKNITHLALTFDNDFEDWSHVNWMIYAYNGLRAKLENVKPFNKSSKYGAVPIYHPLGSLMKRPHLLHPIQLMNEANLTMKFSLKLIGSFHPLLVVFSPSLNPGFKIYVGDYLVFDHFKDAYAGNNWHNYCVNKSTDSILKFPHLSNHKSSLQIIRIESWQSNDGKSYFILDDLFITQTPKTRSTATSTTGSPRKTTSTRPIKTTSTSPSTTRKVTTQRSTTSSSSIQWYPCYLAKSPGPCKSHLTRYFFDPSSLKCSTFVYGGCKGNSNNFETLAECKARCEDISGSEDAITDVCHLPVLEGDCKGYFERFYYDSTSSRCISFIYSGCGGNGNNFGSLFECLSTCSDVSKETNYVTAFPRRHDDCQLPIMRGPCSQKVPMFGFDQKTSTCVNFTYGGCSGNGNRFFSKLSCESVCLGTSNQTTSTVKSTKSTTTLATTTKESVSTSTLTSTAASTAASQMSWCQKPNFKKSRHCKQPSTFFYYDKKSNSCVNVTKCIGKQNHIFKNQNVCENFCKIEHATKISRTCLQPPSSGSCHDRVVRYFFNPLQHECSMFNYTGCGGNSNNYETKSECEKYCKGSLKSFFVDLKRSVCSDRPSIGSCKKNLTRFYYDNGTNTCVKFEGGCDDDANFFDNINDCYSTCLEPNPDAGKSAFIIAETLLAVFLTGIFGFAFVLGYKFFKMRREKENYRIFNQQQERAGSVSSLAADLSNDGSLAYENPVFLSDLERARNDAFQLESLPTRSLDVRAGPIM